MWSALAYRDFRLLCSGMLVSQLGQWMQFTSLTYLIGVVMAGSAKQSALNLGMLGACQAIPVLVLAPIAGYVADRYQRRNTLLITNAMRCVLALGLAFVSQRHDSWVLASALLIAALFAATQSFDSPARQSWVSFIVPRQLLSNAIGLNSFANNFPMMIGPAVAGILISTVGVYVSFYVQAATQCVVFAAVVMMRPAPKANASREPMLAQIASGIRFIATTRALRSVVVMLSVTCVCLRPYNWLLAGFAGHVMNVDAKAYGMMLTAGGVGTIFGALTTALNTPESRGKMWFITVSTTAVSLIVLSFTHAFVPVLVLLTVMGWGTMAFVSLSNVMMQTLSTAEMVGRTMALYSTIMNGLVPSGTLIFGAIGAAAGLPFAYALGGGLALSVGILMWLSHPELRRAG